MREDPIEVDNGPPLPCLSIHLGRRKTSGAENDEVVYLTGRPDEPLDAWLQAANINKCIVFRAIDHWGNVSPRPLDPEANNDVLKHNIQMAGLDAAQFSAHGLRSGYITKAANRGTPLPEAIEQSAPSGGATSLRVLQRSAVQRRSRRALRLLG